MEIVMIKRTVMASVLLVSFALRADDGFFGNLGRSISSAWNGAVGSVSAFFGGEPAVRPEHERIKEKRREEVVTEKSTGSGKEVTKEVTVEETVKG